TRPFTVRTSTASVRDLGTRFIVRARQHERHTDVVVVEGVVAIGPRHAADSVVLRPGDFARIADTSSAVAVRRNVRLSRYLGWTEGQLAFERTPLPEVVSELERWYDVEIEL